MLHKFPLCPNLVIDRLSLMPIYLFMPQCSLHKCNLFIPWYKAVGILLFIYLDKPEVHSLTHSVVIKLMQMSKS
jgi:hypothetical protein